LIAVKALYCLWFYQWYFDAIPALENFRDNVMSKHNVKQYMKSDPLVISPDCTIEEASVKMEKANCGIFPVGTIDNPVGMITDRDLVIRALAQKKSPATTKVSEIMSKQVYSVTEDASIEQAVEMMRKHKVSRMLVKDAKSRITGILSLGHFVRNADPGTLAKIAEHMIGNKAA
jgi:CBS domain-containing protein